MDAVAIEAAAWTRRDADTTALAVWARVSSPEGYMCPVAAAAPPKDGAGPALTADWRPGTGGPAADSASVVVLERPEPPGCAAGGAPAGWEISVSAPTSRGGSDESDPDGSGGVLVLSIRLRGPPATDRARATIRVAVGSAAGRMGGVSVSPPSEDADWLPVAIVAGPADGVDDAEAPVRGTRTACPDDLDVGLGSDGPPGPHRPAGVVRPPNDDDSPSTRRGGGRPARGSVGAVLAARRFVLVAFETARTRHEPLPLAPQKRRRDGYDDDGGGRRGDA